MIFLFLSLVLIAATPDRSQCKWWMERLSEISIWENLLIEAEKNEDWEVAENLRYRIRLLQEKINE